MFFNKYYRRDDLEHQSSLYTHSLPITTGSGQTSTALLQFLSIIRKLPTERFDLCKSHPLILIQSSLLAYGNQSEPYFIYYYR